MTAAGQKALVAAREAALGHLAEMLGGLQERERVRIAQAMSVLQEMLAQQA